ncbi:MAG: family 20 glycosylhydrolase [Psychrobium sp.]
MNKNKTLLAVCAGLAMIGCQDSAGDKTVSTPLTTQDKVDALAANLVGKYDFVSNINPCPEKAGKPVGKCYSAYINLTNPTDVELDNWSVFYSQVYPAYLGESEQLALRHVNGDIHEITPKAGFSSFKAGETKQILMWSDSTLITESEVMPNYWIAVEGVKPQVIASTKTAIDPETQLEIQPYVEPFDNLPTQSREAANDINPDATPAWLYEDNSKVQTLELTNEQIASAIIPTPSKVTVDSQARLLDIASGLKLDLQGVELSSLASAVVRLESLGVALADDGIPTSIKVVPAQDAVKGSYSLKVGTDGIEITASEKTGAFYALQSLAALKTLGETRISVMDIVDSPRYQYRGQHVDVARNFHGKDFLIQLIEQMAAYKLNKLHLHLAEDEGWRLEIPSLPELTSVGSKRCMDLTDSECLQPQLGSAGQPQRDGYLSTEDYKEILRSASQHHIQVIPSLDMPGHSRAAVKAMEARYEHYMKLEQPVEAKRYLLTDLDDKTQYSSIQHYNDNTLNICMESTYDFIDRVLADLQAMHKDAGHPLEMYHIGADETAGAWVDSPACKNLMSRSDIAITDAKHLSAHFIERVSNMVAAKGISVGGWNDGMGETDASKMPSDVYSYIWGTFPGGAHKQASEQAHRGWNTVLSIPDLTYFDFPYEFDPKERGYKWASRRVNSQTVFNFMPDNLPVHAEFRVTTKGQPFVSDDTLQMDTTGKVIHKPLPKGYKTAGIQGQLWSETVRSTEQAQYMVYPRIVSLAERAWHQADWEVPYDAGGAVYSQETNTFTNELRTKRDAQWHAFSQTLAQKELPKLETLGVFYRLPTVGAKVIEGKLHANTSLDGVAIEYREGNGLWKRYKKPVAVTHPVSVRTRTFNGERAGRTLVIEK